MHDNTTYDKILETATNMFSEKGYNGTSMREIAEALNITKAALYYHFPGKEEIFEACITHSMDRLTDGLELLAVEKISVWIKLEKLIGGMCDFAKDRPQKFRLFRQMSEQNLNTNFDMKKMHGFYERQRQAVQLIIENGVKNGEIRNDIPANMISSALVGMVHHTTGPKMRLAAGITMNNKKLTEYLMKLIRGGFEQQ